MDIPNIGVIKKDEENNPIYPTKLLAVPQKYGKIVFFGFLAFIITWMIVMSIIVFEVTSAKEIEKRSSKDIYRILVLLFEISILVKVCFLFFLHRDIMHLCYPIQEIKCNYPRRKNACLLFLFIALSLLEIIVLFVSKNVGYEFAVSIGFNVLSIGIFSLGHFDRIKYCRCKTCLNQKDVKLHYFDECLELFETDRITSEFLQSHFRIPLSSVECIALRLQDGKMIHTFEDDEYIQLYEGTYVIHKRVPSEEVKINYLGRTKLIAQTTYFNEKQLTYWLDIESSGMLSIQSENGEIVHVFCNRHSPINLKEGTFTVKIVNIEPEPAEQISQEEVEDEQIEINENSMLNVD